MACLASDPLPRCLLTEIRVRARLRVRVRVRVRARVMVRLRLRVRVRVCPGACWRMRRRRRLWCAAASRLGRG